MIAVVGQAPVVPHKIDILVDCALGIVLGKYRISRTDLIRIAEQVADVVKPHLHVVELVVRTPARRLCPVIAALDTVERNDAQLMESIVKLDSSQTFSTPFQIATSFPATSL